MGKLAKRTGRVGAGLTLLSAGSMVVDNLYFVADVTIQNYTGKSITENLFD